MPQTRSAPVPSLREAALLNIANHFDSYWCGGNTEPLLELDPEDLKLLNVIGPFEYLHDDMIQELLGILVNKCLLRRHHFHLLLHSYIRHLNLKVCKAVANHSSIVEAISVRCQKITHLDLEGLNNVQPNVLYKLVTSLPELVSLILAYTKTDGEVMEAVAQNCPNLLHLNVSDCRLKDTAFQLFCSQDVPQLKHLIFDGISLSLDTQVALLKNQKKLQNFDETFIDSVFDRMYGEEFLLLKDVLPEWQHDLSELFVISNSAYPEEKMNLCESLRFELIFKCCPFLTQLNLTLEEKASLKQLSKLKHLKSLQMSLNSKDGSLSFESDIVPMLKDVGRNLTCLGFYYLCEVDVVTIGRLCPNLETLKLELETLKLEMTETKLCVEHEEEFPRAENHPACYTWLKKLDISYEGSGCNMVISEADLSVILLNAAQLTHIRLTCVNTLTDRVVIEAHEKHNFRCLRKAFFFLCNSITKETGNALLDSDNPLEQLMFLDCRGVTREDVDGFMKESKQRNFSIVF